MNLALDRAKIRRLCALGAGAVISFAPGGCVGTLSHKAPVVVQTPAAIENPMFVPPMDREFLWNQLVDAIDDYFLIEREQRVQRIGDVLTEGRLDTLPQIGSTIFEPWRGDSTPGFERLQATFQTIRRRAVARVIPASGGYLIEVVVWKELEDLARPEHATVGEITPRQQTSPQSSPVRQTFDTPARLGWIPQGRDASLEAVILSDLSARLAEPPTPQRLPNL